MVTIIAVMFIFLLAGFTQGLTGFGSALVAMPLLCLFLDVKIAVPLSVLNSLVITTYLVVKMRRHIEFKALLPLSSASIPGILVGTTLLKNVPAAVVSTSLGVLLVSYSLYCLLVIPKPRKLHTGWAYVAGFSSGAIGAAFSAGGPPTIIYTALNDWNKDQIKATLTGFFVINATIIVFAHFITGLTTSVVLNLFSFAAPAVLTGTIVGSLLYGRLPRKTFLRIVYCALTVMGVMMIYFS